MSWADEDERTKSLEAVLDAARKTCEANPDHPPLTLLRLAIELHDVRAAMKPPEDARQLTLDILEGVNRTRDEQSTGRLDADPMKE